MRDQGEIRIYAACLAAYNNGILHGTWIDATIGVIEMVAAIRDMLAESPIPEAEEWAIHDYEGFGSLRLSEYESLERVAELAAFFEEHGELGAELVSHYGDLDSARTAIEDHYAGEYQSLADFAEELTEQSTTIPENLRFYIDYERMGRDLEINDLVVIRLGYEQTHIFWAH